MSRRSAKQSKNIENRHLRDIKPSISCHGDISTRTNGQRVQQIRKQNAQIELLSSVQRLLRPIFAILLILKYTIASTYNYITQYKTRSVTRETDGTR